MVLVVKFHSHVTVRDSIELLKSAIEDGPLLLFLEFGIKPILLVEEIDLVPFLVIFIDRILKKHSLLMRNEELLINERDQA